MVKVNKLGIILSKTDLGFECAGVLNPAVIKEGDNIHLFYRAVAKGNYSSIGYCKLNSPLEVASRNEIPLIYPDEEYESHGIEDPRIVKIEDTYYLTYTAFSGVNALGALATSTDLMHWKKQGIIVPQFTYEKFKHLIEARGSIQEKYIRFNQNQKNHKKLDHNLFIWDKNLIFFPRKIAGKFCFFHRIKPDVQIVVSIESLEELTTEFWENYFINFNDTTVLSSVYKHEISYVGGGCPPIETEEGWLIIYHGVHDTANGYVYTACAALLDIENPKNELARLPYPLFFPEQDWELNGEVHNVCFPTGTVIEDDTLYIYYGAADERIAVASVSIQKLLEELLLNKK